MLGAKAVATAKTKASAVPPPPAAAAAAGGDAEAVAVGKAGRKADMIYISDFPNAVRMKLLQLDADDDGTLDPNELVKAVDALNDSKVLAKRYKSFAIFLCVVFTIFLPIFFGVIHGAVKMNKDMQAVNGEMTTITGDPLHVLSTDRTFSFALSSGVDNSIFDGLKALTVSSTTGSVLSFQIAGYARLEDNSVYLFTHSSVSPALHLEGECEHRTRHERVLAQAPLTKPLPFHCPSVQHWSSSFLSTPRSPSQAPCCRSSPARTRVASRRSVCSSLPLRARS